MRREWELEDLIGCWTLDEEEFRLLASKSGATRLGFSLMLKFFEQEARFPRREDVPKAAVDFVAGQVKVAPALFAEYDFTSRQVKNHRRQIREYHGFREPAVGDEDTLIVWLAGDICRVEMSRDRLRSALLARCREVKVEPPTPGQVERLLGAAESMFERQFTETTLGRLAAGSIGRLEELIATGDAGPEGEGEGAWRQAQLPAGAEGGPGADPAGHAAGRDREAGAGQGDEAARWPVRRCLGEDRGRVAGPGDEDVPVRLRRRAGPDPDHAAGRAVPRPQGRDDRRAGGAADPARP